MILLFDENMPVDAAAGFCLLGMPAKDVRTVPGLGSSASDEQIIARCATEGWTWLTRDLKRLRSQHQRQVLFDHKIGGFWCSGAHATAHQLIRAVVLRYDEMKQKARTDRVPFAYCFSIAGKGGLKAFPL